MKFFLRKSEVVSFAHSEVFAVAKVKLFAIAHSEKKLTREANFTRQQPNLIFIAPKIAQRNYLYKIYREVKYVEDVARANAPRSYNYSDFWLGRSPHIRDSEYPKRRQAGFYTRRVFM